MVLLLNTFHRLVFGRFRLIKNPMLSDQVGLNNDQPYAGHCVFNVGATLAVARDSADRAPDAATGKGHVNRAGASPAPT